MKRHWNKYEVKDASRTYWTIFFHAVNIEECKKNLKTTAGSEGYFDLDWYYFIYHGCTAKLDWMTEKQINKLDQQSGMYGGAITCEAHIDNVEREGNAGLWAYAPSPERFLLDYQNNVLGALMNACAGNVIENSVENKTAPK